jgi:ABC-type uncharacterized transport system substrate-binding protein
LGEAGYLEGQNISFEHRSAHDQPDLFPALATELADLKVDVIFARGTWALRGAKNATRTIPIVGIDLEADPVEAGLVASMRGRAEYYGAVSRSFGERKHAGIQRSCPGVSGRRT